MPKADHAIVGRSKWRVTARSKSGSRGPLGYERIKRKLAGAGARLRCRLTEYVKIQS